MNLKRVIGGIFLSFAFLAFFAYAISGVEWVFENPLQSNRVVLLGSAAEGVQSAMTESKAEYKVNAVPELIINAESAISVQTNLSDPDKIFFEINSDLKLPIASLTKLMTAIIVLDNYDLSEEIMVSEIADLQDPMEQDVKLGDTFSAEDFLKVMLVGSSNKSAYALAEKIGEQNFVGLMNQRAKNIGLFNTFFTDPTGLSAENVSTAVDLVKISKYILKNYPLIAEISRIKEFELPEIGKIANTNELLGEVSEVVCSKTGFTTDAKGCLLLVLNSSKNNNYLINVVLGAENRFFEMEKIINWQNAICDQ